MNARLLIRRLRGPAFIMLVGINALLNQWGVLSFSRSWPLYLILFGVLALAERAAIAAAPPTPPSAYPGAYGPGGYPSMTEYPGPTPESHYAPPGATAAGTSPSAGPAGFGSGPGSGAGNDPLAGPNRRT